MKSESLKLTAILVFLIALFAGSMFWVNFHGHLWYGMDMFTYSYEGRLMYQGHTCFPDNWIFGNQYQIIASPNISALFYGLCKDSTTAMSFASSLSVVLTILAFFWCFKKAFSSFTISIGILCVLGGTIFGTHAASYISGLQVLYTMASFYSCYLIVILITLGCWLRLRDGSKSPWVMMGLCVILNFALGMQSLREMLILIIPLLLLDCFYNIAESRMNKSFLFIAVLLLVESAGHLFMQTLNVPTTPIIGDLQLDLAPSSIIANIWASAKNILRISGVAIVKDGIRYLPLSICAMVILAVILYSLSLIIRKQDQSPLAKCILFSFVSVLCVFGVGVLLMRTRDIYYFVYWLLAALSVAYVFDSMGVKSQKWFVSIICIICMVNYGFNFIPAFSDYHRYGKKLESFTQSLVDRGVKVIYVDATPIFAASSHDAIVSQSFWLDINMETGYPLTVFPSDKHTVVYDDKHYDSSLICFSDHYLHYLPEAPEAFQNSLKENLELFDELTLGPRKFVLYRSKKRVIAPVDVWLK